MQTRVRPTQSQNFAQEITLGQIQHGNNCLAEFSMYDALKYGKGSFWKFKNRNRKIILYHSGYHTKEEPLGFENIHDINDF